MTSIACYFEVIGRGYDPSDLTKAVGIEPSSTWRYGEIIPPSRRPYKHDGWSLESGKVESLDFQEVALPLLRRMLPASAVLRDYCQRRGLEVGLNSTVYIEDGQAPCVHLDLEAIRALHQLSAELDIDIL